MDHWSIVKAAAEEKWFKGAEWASFFHKRKYGIKTVHSDMLYIEKRSGGERVYLSALMIQNAANKLMHKKQFSTLI